MTAVCFRCEKDSTQVKPAYFVRRDVFACAKCATELEEMDPLWEEIQKCWRILGGWRREDENRYRRWKSGKGKRFRQT